MGSDPPPAIRGFGGPQSDFCAFSASVALLIGLVTGPYQRQPSELTPAWRTYATPAD